MDSEIIYSVFGIVVFVIIIVLVLRSKEVTVSRSQEDKKQEIISNYKQKLQDALKSVGDKSDARVAKKKEMLKKISHELALNIYFDEDDIREIILNLSKE